MSMTWPPVTADNGRVRITLDHEEVITGPDEARQLARRLDAAADEAANQAATTSTPAESSSRRIQDDD